MMELTPGRAAAAAAALVIVAYLWDRGYRVIVKDGVVLALQPEMTRALPVIDAASVEAIGRGAIITSGTDGRHSAGSRHYRGLAVDLRTRDLTGARVSAYAAELDERLNGSGAWRAQAGHGHSYDVIIEPDHIHIEYDPAATRKGVIRL